MRPLTDSIPKCLVPIQGKPLLHIWLELCAQHGIREVLINAHAHTEVLRAHLMNYTSPVHLRLYEEKSLLGSAGTLRANRHWVQDEQLFWVFYADVLTNADLEDMRKFHIARPSAATLGLYEAPNPTECGIATVNADDIIESFVEKPSQPAGNSAFSGLLIGTPKFLDLIPDSVPCDLGFHVLHRLAGQARAYRIRQYVQDIGTAEKYKASQVSWPGLPTVCKGESCSEL